MEQTDSDRLITSIYSALLGETGWEDVVHDVATTTRADMAVMFYHEADRGSGAITLAAGVTDAIMGDYDGYYAARNPWMSLLPSIPIGLGVVGEEVLARDQFLQTEYYNDFFRRHEQETSVGVTVRQDNACFFLLSLLSGDKDFDRNRIRADVLSRIAPHLRRASDFYRAVPGSSLANGLSEAGGFATIVVNSLGHVVYASAAGAERLASGEPLGVSASGRVSFCDVLAQSVFEHALQGRDADLLTKTIVAGGYEVTFLDAAEERGAIFLGGTLTILMKPLVNNRPTDIQKIAARFGLTPAECRVFEGIVSGLCTAEIASAGIVSIETVRTQLKSIFAKTGTNRQSALVRLAANFADNGDGRHDGSRKR